MKQPIPIEPTEQLRALLGGQKLAVLATIGDGRPHLSLVAFAATPDLRTLLFATEEATRKYANLVADPRVSLLVDSRTHQDSDLQEAAAVTALGWARTVQGASRQALAALLLARHPLLADLLESPSGALVRVRVERYLLVTRFQQVVELCDCPINGGNDAG